MKRIVNFSGGLCSFWAAHRVIEKHGPQDVILLFADTLVEDEDLYRFNEQASGLLGVPITRIATGETPWDLFRRHGLIGNNRFPICSIYLKREPLNDWMEAAYEMRAGQENFLFESAAVVLGFDWTEDHRVREMRLEHPAWIIEAPMTEEPIWDKCRMEREARSLGLEIPRLYKLGFPHNNCGGRCVRAGISHWVHLYRTLPDKFAEWEKEEWETAADFRTRGIEPLSMLKDRRGGETKNLYLRDLRARIEAGEKFTREDWGGCGCGGATTLPTAA